MDFTGRFPLYPSTGNEYIIIAYNFDASVIIGEHVENWKASALTAAWRNLHKLFQNSGLALNTWILDHGINGVSQNTMLKNEPYFN